MPMLGFASYQKVRRLSLGLILLVVMAIMFSILDSMTDWNDKPQVYYLDKLGNEQLSPHLVQIARNNRTKKATDFRTPGTVDRKRTAQSFYQAFVTAQPRKVNPFKYQYVIYPRSCDVDPYMVVLINSGVTNKKQRTIIRKTWGAARLITLKHSNQPKRIRIVFLLGLPRDTEYQRKVLEESKTYRDILQGNFIDEYRNLTLKSLMGLKWTTEFCRHSAYVVKTDDDVFIDTPPLVQRISEQNKTGALFGVRIGGDGFSVFREGRWAISEKEYPFKYLPPYLAGSLYGMSRDVAEKLFAVSEYVVIKILIEDVFITGILSHIKGIRPYNVPGFPLGETPKDGLGPNFVCAMLHLGYFGIHGVSAETMLKAWNMSQEKNCSSAN